METTRHFTATVYVVNDGATALHDHQKLGLTIPPGGHVDRDELPHETAVRECEEETGLTPTIVRDEALTGEDSPAADGGVPAGHDALATDTCRPLPRPRRQLLYDIDVHDGRVAHQHVDHIYFATVPSRDLDPGDGEAGADAWAWYDRDDLRNGDLDPDVVALGTAAIRAAEGA